MEYLLKPLQSLLQSGTFASLSLQLKLILVKSVLSAALQELDSVLREVIRE